MNATVVSDVYSPCKNVHYLPFAAVKMYTVLKLPDIFSRCRTEGKYFRRSSTGLPQPSKSIFSQDGVEGNYDETRLAAHSRRVGHIFPRRSQGKIRQKQQYRTFMAK